MQTTDSAQIALGRFTLDLRRRALLDGQDAVTLGSRAFETLAVLASAPGRLFSKEELLDRVWPGLNVEENNLQVQIATLRRVLGRTPEMIVTVPGRGYRLVMPAGRAAPALSVMVLPFHDFSGAGLNDHVSDSLTTSIRAELGRSLPGGIVASRQASLAVAADGGRSSTTRYVLEGSIAIHGGRARVSATLIDQASDTNLLAEQFDVDWDEPLARLDLITGRLVRAVALRVLGADAARDCGGSPEEMILRARAAAHAPWPSAEGAATAQQLFRAALAATPGHTDALAGLAASLGYAVVNGYVPAARRDAQLAEAEALSVQALARQPHHGDALRARMVVLRAQGRFDDAIAATQVALALHPLDPGLLRELGLNLLYLGRFEAAAKQFRQADALAPQDPSRWTWMQGLGRAMLYLGQDPEAVAALRLTVESNPGYAPGRTLLAAALALVGDQAGARQHLRESARLDPDGLGIAVLTGRRAWVPPPLTSETYRLAHRRVLQALRQPLRDLRAGDSAGVDHTPRRRDGRPA